MKKRCNRRPTFALPPPGLRPKLRPEDLTKIGLMHVETLDAIARGEATQEQLLDWCENVFTWTFVAQLLGKGEQEMLGQTALATRLIDRWARTGAVRFSGQDYQMAKWGVAIMDQLAAETDTATAARAAIWSTECLRRLKADAEQLRAQHLEATAP